MTYSAFTSEAGLDNDKETVIFPPPAEVTDNEASLSSDADHPDEEDFDKDWSIPDAEGADDTTSVDFDKDAPHSATTVDIDEEEKLENLLAELLCLHHKFNHISFGKIKALA